MKTTNDKEEIECVLKNTDYDKEFFNKEEAESLANIFLKMLKNSKDAKQMNKDLVEYQKILFKILGNKMSL